MISDNGVENPSHNPLLVNAAEVTKTVQRLTNEQQRDFEQSMTALLKFRATRCCEMMDELRPNYGQYYRKARRNRRVSVGRFIKTSGSWS
jgi:hypothetical protein